MSFRLQMLAGLIFSFALTFLVTQENPQARPKSRAVASFNSYHCKEVLAELKSLSSSGSSSFKAKSHQLFSRLSDLGRDRRQEFSYRKFRNLYESYSSADEFEDVDSLQSVESVMAQIEFLAHKIHPEQTPFLELPDKTQKKLRSLAENIHNPRSFTLSLNYSNDYLRRYFYIRTGVEPGMFKGFKSSEKEVFDRILMEELAAHGLSKFVNKYKIFKRDKRFLGFIFKTKIGGRLAMTIMNTALFLKTGGLWGAYIPQIKNPKFSKALLEKMLKEGLTEENLKFAKLELKEQSFMLKHGAKARDVANALRKWYYAGVGAVITYFVAWDFANQWREVSDLEDQIDDVSAPIDDAISDAMYLQDAGIPVLGEDEELILDYGSMEIKRTCSKLEKCLNRRSKGGQWPEAGTFAYSFCKKSFDPKDLCERL